MAKQKKAVRDIFDKSGNILLRKGTVVTLNEESVRKYARLGVLQDVRNCDRVIDLDSKNKTDELVKNLIFANKKSEPAWKKYEDVEFKTSVKENFSENSVNATIDSIEAITKKFIYDNRIADEKKMTRAAKTVENLVFYSKNEGWFSHFQTLANYENWLYTHCVNVALISSIIAQELNYNYKMQKELCLGAVLCDVGKVLIPKSILNKKRYSSDDDEMIENHCEMGYAMLQDSDIFEVSKMIILQHHEYLNGYGYPVGLKGEDILEQSQIVCVADVFDAGTSGGVPYCDTDSIENVLEQMLSMPDVYNSEYVGILKRYLLNPFK